MPSWNEKSHVTPTININLEQCTRGRCGPDPFGTFRHDSDTCAATPVLIPLPLDAFRSVTFTVRLGECICPANGGVGAASWNPPPECVPSCPARPIRVTCSISGTTWESSEASEVTDIDIPEHLISADVIDPIANACGARWALVKALVLGLSTTPALSHHPELVAQRDAVYAAIAGMALADAARTQAWIALPLELRKGPGPTSLAGEVLERYVARLIEQVGILGVEP